MRLGISNVCGLPLTFGLFRPMILLPTAAAQWPSEQRRTVLLHELGHVVRLDLATQMLGQLACAMYWFHPLAWMAERQLRADREAACDDLVLAHGTPATAYAEHLLAIARAVRGRPILNLAAVPMARRSGLRQRVKAVLDPKVNRRSVSRRLAVLCAVVAVAIVLPLWSVRLGIRPARAEEVMPSAQPATAMQTAAPDAAVPALGPASAAGKVPIVKGMVQSAKVMHLVVVDQVTHAPLAGVTVQTCCSGPYKRMTAADGSADVPIRVIPDDNKIFNFEVELSSPHYAGKILQWYWKATSPGEAPPSNYVAPLEPGQTIGGRVVDDDGKPVAGANVVIDVKTGPLGPDHERTSTSTDEPVKTDVDGKWTFDGVPRQFNVITIGVWDYQYVVNDGGFYGQVEMPAYSPSSALLNRSATFTLHHGVTVGGVVLGPNDKPMANVAVSCSNFAFTGMNTVPALVTGKDGRFAFTFKSGASVVLSTRAKGYAQQTAQATADVDQHNVIISLAKGRHLEGRVFDPIGKPIPGASVSLYSHPDSRSAGLDTTDATLLTDQQGRFHWNQAAADTVYADIWSEAEPEGFLLNNQIELKVGSANVITLHKPLRITGTVVDAVTGKPIPEFHVIQGLIPEEGQPISFFPAAAEAMKNGTFECRSTARDFVSYPYCAVRVEASGYLPADSRRIKADEGLVHLEFKLQPTVDWKPILLLPDGKPAVDVVAALVASGEGSYQFNGEIDPQNENRTRGDTFTTVAGADGTLDLPPQRGLAKLVVIDEAGYAEVDQDVLKQNATIRMQPWSRIHGRLMIGSTPGAGQRVAVARRMPMGFDPSAPSVTSNIEVKTDAEGWFTIEHTLPGSLVISRYVKHGDGTPNWWGEYAHTQNLNVRPGETVEVTVGGNGKPVVGKLLIPSGIDRTGRMGLGRKLSNEIGNGAVAPSDARGCQRWNPGTKNELGQQLHEDSPG